MTPTAENGHPAAPGDEIEPDHDEGEVGRFEAPSNDFDRNFSTEAEVGPAVRTIAQALARMDKISASAPEGDGLRAFNELYTVITLNVEQWLDEGQFADRKFLRGLDVAFANRYFAALRLWGLGKHDQVPRVWRVLLERRCDSRIAPIQFAVAGVNAHINFDLAPAVVKTCETIKASLGHGYQRNDYQRINEIFAAKYKILRDELTEGPIDMFDEGWRARAIDYASSFVVEQARDEAWESAERIDVYRLGGDTNGVERVLRRLDRHFGFVGRSLLWRGLF